MNIRIRRAEQHDLDAIVALNTQVQELHVEARPDFFKSTSREEVREWLGSALHDPVITVWVATSSEEVVGYLLAERRERPGNPFCHGRRKLEIDQIAIDVAHRDRGVGRALIEAAIEHARGLQLEHVELNVWAFNDVARRAFEKAGFVAQTHRMELKSV